MGETVSDRLRVIRQARGMSQAELGRRLDRTQTCISYWESGKREPGLGDLALLANALKVRVTWLAFGDEA